MRILTLIVLSFICFLCSASKYYVKAGGSDSFSGLDDEHAWAHHPWMITWTGNTLLSPGDTVCMKRGNIWTIVNPDAAFLNVAQNGTSGKPITTTWYGTSGHKPIIQISGDHPYSVIQGLGKSYIVFNNLDIRHFDNTQDLKNYQNGIMFGEDEDNNVPHDWLITNCDISNIPNIGIFGKDDSYNIIIGNISATKTATNLDYSNQIYKCGYAGIILCGCDPITSLSRWDVYFNYIHDIDNSSLLRDAYGIAFTTQTVGTGQGYSTGWPSNCTSKYNRVENVPGHAGIDCHGGTNIYIQDNYVNNCLNGIVTQASDRVYAETAILNNVYIERNTIENNGNSPLSNYVFIFVASENVKYRVTNCFIRDNRIFYTSRPSNEDDAYGICFYHVDGMTIEGNKIFNGPIGGSGGGISVSNNENRKVKNILIRNNWIYNWDHGLDITINALDGNLNLHNNIIFSHGHPLFGKGGTISNYITIYNNTIMAANSADYPWLIDFASGGAVTIAKGANLDIKNNIIGFTSNVSKGIYIRSPEFNYGGISIDYNIYWNSTNDSQFGINGIFYNWSNWNALNFDTHSLNNVDPEFKNLSGSYSQDIDFKPKLTSPAINRGIYLGLTQDYIGTFIDGLPDIGAFEFPIPILMECVVEKRTPSVLELKYNLSLANIVPAVSSFSVTVNSNSRNIDSIYITGSQVLIAISSPIVNGDVITLTYIPPSTNPLQTIEGGQAESLIAKTVTNNVSVSVPVYISSVIENTSPSVLVVSYDLSLANIVPATSAFDVQINSVRGNINSVAIVGGKLEIVLSNNVSYGDVITFSYLKPLINPLQAPTGGQAASITDQPVINQVIRINTSPIPVIKYQPYCYSGFISELDASESYDPDNDKLLLFEWSIPENIPVSSINSPKIQFLCPVISDTATINFVLKISDSESSQNRNIPIKILPYWAELGLAEISRIEATDSIYPNYPHNIIDGNSKTIWSALGNDQILVLNLKEPFRIHHIKIGFDSDHAEESYFDILGSIDYVTWEEILVNSSSCPFSGNLQVFEFPSSKMWKEYSFLKFIGKGNIHDKWNYISEFKIFGYPSKNKASLPKIIIYPNPANNYIYVSFWSETSLKTNNLRIISAMGEIVFEIELDPSEIELLIPFDLKQGIYIIQLRSFDQIVFVQKIAITK